MWLMAKRSFGFECGRWQTSVWARLSCVELSQHLAVGVAVEGRRGCGRRAGEALEKQLSLFPLPIRSRAPVVHPSWRAE